VPRIALKIEPYKKPSGGWGAARAVSKTLWREGRRLAAPLALRRQNKVGEFKCVSCAWAKPAKPHIIEVGRPRSDQRQRLKMAVHDIRAQVCSGRSSPVATSLSGHGCRAVAVTRAAVSRTIFVRHPPRGESLLKTPANCAAREATGRPSQLVLAASVQ
jgi:hypothetical protein